jgi:hypothetical protein
MDTWYLFEVFQGFDKIVSTEQLNHIRGNN